MPYLDHEAGGWARVNTAHDAEPAGDGDGDDDGDDDDDGLVAVVVWSLLDGDLGDVSDWKDSCLHRHLSRQPIGFCNTAEKRAGTRKRSGRQGSCRLRVHITLAFPASGTCITPSKPPGQQRGLDDRRRCRCHAYKG